MRRRFGAFHSDSVEDFEKLAQQGLNIPLFYYNFVEAGAESSEAVSDDMDTEVLLKFDGIRTRNMMK